ncbi:ECF transporter S component family protein [Nocardioides pacificus]
MDGTSSGRREGARWDLLAERLQALRLEVGEPSYAEIARRITERRLARGLEPHASRVARTTVYDAFRTGRARVNIALVREIVDALDGEDGQVDEWIALVRGQSAPGSAPETPSDPPAVPALVASASDAPASRERPGLGLVLALMAVCVLINLLGRTLVDFLSLPVYLDMVGTAVAAIVLGPWLGAAVGGTTNLLGVATSGTASLPFTLVNVAGALVWGYGVRRWGLGRTLPRYLSLNVLVALVCSLIAAPILVLVFDGSTGHGEDTITASFLALTDELAMAVGLSNLLSSLGDKVISGFLALVAVSALPAVLRPPWPLPLTPADERTAA